MQETRRPAVAGQFYEATEERLKETIKKCFTDKRTYSGGKRRKGSISR